MRSLGSRGLAQADAAWCRRRRRGLGVGGDADDDGLRRWRAALVRVLLERHERVRLREVGCGATARDVVLGDGEASRSALLAAEVAGDDHLVALFETVRRDVRAIHEQHVAMAVDAAVTIV